MRVAGVGGVDGGVGGLADLEGAGGTGGMGGSGGVCGAEGVRGALDAVGSGRGLGPGGALGPGGGVDSSGVVGGGVGAGDGYGSPTGCSLRRGTTCAGAPAGRSREGRGAVGPDGRKAWRADDMTDRQMRARGLRGGGWCGVLLHPPTPEPTPAPSPEGGEGGGGGGSLGWCTRCRAYGRCLPASPCMRRGAGGPFTAGGAGEREVPGVPVSRTAWGIRGMPEARGAAATSTTPPRWRSGRYAGVRRIGWPRTARAAVRSGGAARAAVGSAGAAHEVVAARVHPGSGGLGCSRGVVAQRRGPEGTAQGYGPARGPSRKGPSRVRAGCCRWGRCPGRSR